MILVVVARMIIVVVDIDFAVVMRMLMIIFFFLLVALTLLAAVNCNNHGWVFRASCFSVSIVLSLFRCLPICMFVTVFGGMSTGPTAAYVLELAVGFAFCTWQQSNLETRDLEKKSMNLIDLALDRLRFGPSNSHGQVQKQLAVTMRIRRSESSAVEPRIDRFDRSVMFRLVTLSRFQVG